MVKKSISKSNSQRCKEYRQRIKTQKAKDDIEKNLDNYIKTLKKVEKTENNGLNVDSLDSGWRNPESNLVDQFQHESKQQYNLFGELEGEINPLDLASHAQNLRNMFGSRAE